MDILDKNKNYLEEENKVFIKGRVSEEDDAASKLICESVIPFEQTKKELWLQYADKKEFLSQEYTLYEMLAASDGDDQVIIYCKAERADRAGGARRFLLAAVGRDAVGADSAERWISFL